MTRALDLLLRACRSGPARWLAERVCRNRSRLPKAETVEAVVAAVHAHYREHRWEAALAARQAKAYQRGHWRHRARHLRDQAPDDDPSLRARLQRGAAEAHRRQFSELGRLEEPEEVIGYLARYYADDMVADFDPAFFVAFRWLSRRIFPHFLGSLRVDEASRQTLGNLPGLLGRVPLFFVPNHVSNADHLPICFALSDAGAWQPLIAAGANLFRGVSAQVMPRVNAYKIRREYIGEDSRWFYQVKWFQNPVYRRVHTEYLRHAWDRSEPFLFYIEGTRSRDGRLGAPKTGILEDVHRYVQATGREALFVPVSLSYAVVPEDVEIEASRRGENISGRDIVAQLGQLDRQYGAYRSSPIHVRFAPPLGLGPGEGDLDRFVGRLMAAIGAGIVRPFTSMAATAVLRVAGSRPGQAWVRLSEVVGEVRREFGQAAECRGVDVAAEVGQALATLGARGFLHPTGEEGCVTVADEPMLRQYANRIAHRA
ncbi:MAG: 1-acyl-sn-glycerol-3-phosphate acyltransferase [Deferrisomatales bacterium]